MKTDRHKDKFKALAEATVDAVITISEDGVILSTNSATESLFGYDKSQLEGRNIKMLMPEQWASKHDEYLSNYQATGIKKVIGIGREVQGLNSDGSIFPMHLTIGEYEVDGVVYYIGIIHDISSQKLTENALLRFQKMEAIGQLTGGVAHDFNNLLTVITGNLELLDMQIDDCRQRSLLKDAQDAADLGADLTARLLAFAKRSVLAPEAVNLNELILSLESILNRTLGANIELSTSLESHLSNPVIDPSQVENAIINLAINARDAMPTGGGLAIETKNIDIDQEYAENEIDLKPGRYVIISVTDTGTGMSKGVLSHVFEPFFSTKDLGRGTGLGLSTIYGFAKQSGGHVTVYSELGLGTTVNLYLPTTNVIENQNVQKPDPIDEQLSLGNGELILVVEDDERVRRITAQRLDKLNYQVITAQNGDEALKILSEVDNINLIFTDLVMPGKTSGYDLVNQVHKQTPKLLILMTSGYAEDLMHGKKLTASQVSLLRKPYKQVELARSVRTVLGATT